MTASQVNSSHPPLVHSKRQIRLFSLSEDADGKITCNLSVFDLSSCPPFIALSYVWGSPSIRHEITLNGHAFFIRHNLYSALKSISNHMRTATKTQAITKNSLEAISSEPNADELKRFHQSPGCWKYFWIDAICINQNEVSERNHQVRMMSDIYKGAVFVLVWFGLSCEKALHLLATADLAKLRTVHRPYTGHFQKSDFSEPLIPLLESDYWSRMWIVQEFVLAQDLVFASGSVLVHWDRANHLFPEVYAHAGPGEIGSAITLVNERRHHRFREQQGMRPDLHELFRRFRFMKCSDPRDRVFALSGILGESSNLADNVLVVDYSLTPAQLSTRIVRLASRSLKREILKELHGFLDAALEVNRDNLDAATNKELSLIYEGIPDGDEYKYPKALTETSSEPERRIARNLGQAMSIVNDRVRSEETSEAFRELKYRVEDWRGHNPTQFGTLLLYDSVIITKDKVRRPYRAYLFRNILLICKELELQRKRGIFQFWKSRRLHSDKQTKLQLTDRIFLNNIDSVIVRPNPGSYTCDVLWFAANEKDKQCFSFEFAAEAQMNLWVSTLNEARARFDAAYGTERNANSHLLIEGAGPPISDDEADEVSWCRTQ